MPQSALRTSTHFATAAASTAAVLIGLAALSACGHPTEIVLTIDTDLGVPTEIDQVQITITGPSQMDGPLSVDLTAANRPPFPLTLGLTPGDGAMLSPVGLHAVGLLAGNPIVAQDMRAAFTADSTRRVSMFLSVSCEGMSSCPSDETCVQGTCTPIDQPSEDWTGAPPGRPGLFRIADRLLWSSGWHSCATLGSSLTPGFSLMCWGRNDDGDLGTGNLTRVATRRAVVSLPAPISMGLGEFHSCTCDQMGRAFCWGSNSDGQLGLGMTGADLPRNPTPTQVLGINDCTQITGGGYHTCALRTGGRVSCWGRNTSGQCGQPASMSSFTMPQQVPNLFAVVEVRAGETYTCARTTNEPVVCWGDNSVGQLGDGRTTSRETPDRVANVMSSSELITGRSFACVRLGTGHVSCWGSVPKGGTGTTSGPATKPVEISGIEHAFQVGIGHQHACVLDTSGAVSCWGSNQFGQLGNGTGIDLPAPLPAEPILRGVTSIAVGDVHSCARLASGEIDCWGQNILYQLGDGTSLDKESPTPVVGF